MIGQRLGESQRYEVTGTIGAGAMGVVYDGFDHRMQRRVAIKVLAPTLARDEKVRERFRTEALIQGGLTHPNIGRATDVIEDGDQIAMVMDFLEGGSLEEHVAASGGRLGFEDLLALVRPILDAVEAAHQKGIVHRDLKPANIMIDRSSGQPIPKVVDFGIAKVLGSGAKMTREGAVMGTPAFMPPEQLKGHLNLDHRADVYALGAIVYHLATGMLPFGGGTEYEITHKVLSGERPPPASQLTGGLPEHIDAWLETAMAFERSQRFESVAAMRAALDEVARGAAIPAPAVGATPRPLGSAPTVFEPEPAASPRRPASRVGWILAGVACLAVVGLLIYAMTVGLGRKDAKSAERTDRAASQGPVKADAGGPGSTYGAAIAPVAADPETTEGHGPATPPAPAAASAGSAAAAAADRAACEVAAAANTENGWQGYLRAYPGGACADQARTAVGAFGATRSARAEAERAEREAAAARAARAEASRAEEAPAEPAPAADACSDGTTCSSGEVCFGGQCSPESAVSCPYEAQCTPSYGRVFWAIERICARRWTTADLDRLKQLRWSGSITGEDLIAVFNTFGALSGYRFKQRQDLNALYYGPNSSRWLPGPCRSAIGSFPKLPGKMYTQQAEIRDFWKANR